MKKNILLAVFLSPLFGILFLIFGVFSATPLFKALLEDTKNMSIFNLAIWPYIGVTALLGVISYFLLTVFQVLQKLVVDHFAEKWKK